MRAKVRCGGDHVLVNLDERVFLEITPEAALELAAAIRQQALRAQEYRDRDRLSMEGALLLRTGAPFTLSDRPDVLDRARLEAAWNTGLRRALPAGVKAESLVGVPKVIKEAA